MKQLRSRSICIQEVGSSNLPRSTKRRVFRSSFGVSVLTVYVFAVTDFHYPDREFFILNCLMDFKFGNSRVVNLKYMHCYKESKSAIIVR